ncbi:unnamed protein product [Notodromas monacha]|uniref:Large ribosomal subunit protein uL23m n=1 Tax=Notodromas monacha TaxID=399045 RepID=A0A7R9GDN3_9CRUS|nr:unnamed protein product [Notodromas monacha]CAG0918878.1 unnamed protein product [Notodromas monacha]
MDILKQEIMRKKRQLEEANVLSADRKYFKRGELHEHAAETSPDKSATREELRSNKTSAKGSVEEDFPILPRKEVVRRLRERSEPALLFGESHEVAFRRLRELEILMPEENKGFRNDFQAAMERVDQTYLEELVKNQGASDGTKNCPHDVHIVPAGSEGDDILTLDEIIEKSKEMAKGNNDYDSGIVLSYLKFLLRRWGDDLNSRSMAEKMSVKGKMASATYSQTQSYLKSLFRQLRKRKLPEDLLDSVVEIVLCLLERDYLKANDAYLQMAIGNAPWPIGVTMVGIHARTGREKIFSKNVAHVLNDETQRKYIQGLKRLMTKCQQFYPTVPSKSVDYPRYVKGNPQLRVFLPNFWMKLVKPEDPMPKNIVTFIVSTEMTRFDVKNYLTKIYKVPVANVALHNHIGKTRLIEKGFVVKDDDYKVAYVTLPKNEWFEFPDLFPEDVDKEEMKPLEDMKQHQKEMTDKRNKRWDRKTIPDWFSC